ncbi:MAG: hypothetical protein NTV25_08585 [Methanothrix sp.]|nr:hypothetical protein [Methanothrix sp.]
MDERRAGCSQPGPAGGRIACIPVELDSREPRLYTREPARGGKVRLGGAGGALDFMRR